METLPELDDFTTEEMKNDIKTEQLKAEENVLECVKIEKEEAPCEYAFANISSLQVGVRHVTIFCHHAQNNLFVKW